MKIFYLSMESRTTLFSSNFKSNIENKKNALLAVMEIVVVARLHVLVKCVDRLLDTVLLIKCLNIDSLFVQIGLILS